MENGVVINQVIMLFLILVVGVVARKRKIISDETKKGLSELLLNITVPFMVIASFNFSFSKDMLRNAGIVFICSLLIHGASALIGKLLYYKYPEKTKAVLRFITIFSNCGFMGFPVLESLYGKEGVFYGSIHVIHFNIFIWTVGVMLFTGKKDMSTIRKAVINPGIISVCIGLVIFLFSLKLPVPIYKTLDMVGSMTTPLSMIIVGAIIADMNIKDVFSGFAVYYGTIIRLIAMPLLVLAVLRFFGIDRMLLGILVVSVAMPAAANTAVFAEKYNADAPFASRCIFVSTIFSIFTIPLFILLL